MSGTDRERPWASRRSDWPQEVTGDDAVAFMDRVGVDGALFVSAFSLYRFDASYAVEVQARHPGRFGIIKPLDTRDPAVAEALTDWAAQPGAVGARIMMVSPGVADPEGVDRICSAAARHGLPVNVLCWGNLAEFAEVAGRHPETQLVIDHLGINQPTEPPASPEPFADLDDVLALARFDHVAIKVSGACTLSHEPFPFPDIWDPLARIFDAYGLGRLHVGNRLDARRQRGRPRGIREGLFCHRPAVRLGSSRVDGRQPGADLQLGADGSARLKA